MERTAPNLSLSLASLGFLFLLFQIGPTFVDFAWFRPMTVGDAVDLATCYVVLPSVALLYLRLREAPGREGVGLGGSGWMLLVGCIAYANGHGLHLSANSLDRLTREGEPIWSAVYFYDEVLGHYVWHAGTILVCGALLLEGLRRGLAPLTGWDRLWIGLGAGMAGFAYFCDGVEGQTTPLEIPAAVVGGVYAYGRRANAVAFFFAVAALTATGLFAVWGLWHRGFPEFSAVGLIQ